MLFFCLWVLAVLSVLAVGISSRVAAEMRLAQYAKNNLLSFYLAKAALNQALLELEKDETPAYDTLYELQQKRTKELGIGSFTFDFSDEESRININTASQSLWDGLPGIDSELAEKIATSELKNFSLKEELLLIDGMTQEKFSAIKDLITVQGSGKININTASQDMLKIAGLPDEVIEAVMDYRNGEDKEALTEDDKAYVSLPAEVPDNLFGTSSNYLRLNISTSVLNKPVKNYYIVLERSSGKIKSWVEK